MTVFHVLAAAVLAFLAGLGVAALLRRRAVRADSARRILLPFGGHDISRRALQAAVRLARAEDAVIMPAYLARVPMTLPLDAPLPGRCAEAMPVFEAIEQRVTGQGVPVDARISRGRTERDALRRLLEREHVDRVIVSVPRMPNGLDAEDLEWMLKRVDAEVMILREAR